MIASKTINTHISVDCVVFGFDGKQLKVTLIERSIEEMASSYNDKKLPGSLIYDDENLDDAAYRILNELTGLTGIYMSQFFAFGDPDRSKNPRDILWLERTTHLKTDRIVTVAYVALIKINRKFLLKDIDTTVGWYDVNEVPQLQLAFDHSKIIQKGLEYIRNRFDLEPQILFELLPKKFSIAQLRNLYDYVHQITSDVRNFQKQILKMPYLVVLDEFEENVSHRPARLYSYRK
jgi:8-oxo-dGTP diphosphatase